MVTEEQVDEAAAGLAHRLTALARALPRSPRAVPVPEPESEPSLLPAGDLEKILREAYMQRPDRKG